MQDQPVGSRESHPRDTLTAGEDLQTKVSTNVDLLSFLWQIISCQSRTEEQLPVYQPPKKEEVVYSWEDFYPNKSVEVNFALRQTAFINFFSQKCEECESSFFWRDFYHGCEVSSVGMRWLSGIVEFCKNVSFFVIIIFFCTGEFFSGSPRVAPILDKDPKEEFTMVTAKGGAKLVDKLAKHALNLYINDLVYDILNTALEMNSRMDVDQVVKEQPGEQDMYLQLSSQV